MFNAISAIFQLYIMARTS